MGDKLGYCDSEGMSEGSNECDGVPDGSADSEGASEGENDWDGVSEGADDKDGDIEASGVGTKLLEGDSDFGMVGSEDNDGVKVAAVVHPPP